MAEPAQQSPETRRLVDPETGQTVHLVYAFPPQLLQGQEGDDDGISLAELGRRLWRGRWIVAACALLGGLLGAGYSFLLPNVYTATVVALPPSDSGGRGLLSQYAGLAAMSGIQLPTGPASSVDEIMAILESRRLAEPLIERFDLVDYYFPGADEPPPREAVHEAFREDFTAEHSQKTNRITFGYTHQEPESAAAVAGAAADLLGEIFNEIHHSSAEREVAFLEERLARTERDLAAAAEALAAFQRETGAVEIEAQTRATIEAVAEMQGELIAQQVELRALLASQASEDNPRIQLLQERIAAAQDQMRDLLGSERSGEGVLVALGAAPELGIRYLRLLREVKKQEAVHTAVSGQLEAARVNQVRNSEAVTIVDGPGMPEQKSGPRRSRIVALTLLLGAVLGTGLAAVRTRPWHHQPAGSEPV